VVICLERGADLHMAQLMPLPLAVSCFSEIQICFAFLVPAHPDSRGKRADKRGVCVCFTDVDLRSAFIVPIRSITYDKQQSFSFVDGFPNLQGFLSVN